MLSCINSIPNEVKIYITLTLTVALLAAEMTVGYAYGSNTLVADSFHMFSDAISFIVSLIAIKKKPQETSKKRKTFGYRRSEQVGAMIHGSLLLGLAFSVGTSAVLRLVEPEKVENPKLALIVGSTGLIVDFTGIIMFFQDDLKDGSMNIRSLFLEKMGDLAGTIVVIVTCALSYVYEEEDWVKYVDPIGTLLFCCVLIWAIREIFSMVLRILMQDAPRGFRLEEMEKEIENLGVTIVKNNVWQIDNNEVILSIVVQGNDGGMIADNVVDVIKEIFKSYAEEFEDLNTTVEFVPYGVSIEAVQPEKNKGEGGRTNQVCASEIV